MANLESLRRRIVRKGLIVLTLHSVRKTTARVGRSEIWIEPDRLGKIADCFVVVTLLAVRKTSMEVVKRVIWIDRIASL